ncbi:hypothetical protein [Achromobacter sp. Marseille-Q4962]|uniref:hypothetical protein n=1 Tax=Achromobacter sp. Marseille-Q4962 TaxID=2942202 RepID=UPI002072C951|nr:hypothetical protein [Achromobacter sp. Marseille-Q4962]
MPHSLPSVSAGPASGAAARRSAFLVSAWRRMAWALAAVAGLWLLTGWALQWWPPQ